MSAKLKRRYDRYLFGQEILSESANYWCKRLYRKKSF